MADIYFRREVTLDGPRWQLHHVRNVKPAERAALRLLLTEYFVISGDIGDPDMALGKMSELRDEMAVRHRLHFEP